jgi:hypothetical protein
MLYKTQNSKEDNYSILILLQKSKKEKKNKTLCVWPS